LIAPISVPVGNRTRIITALSHHIPVIAHTNTSMGNTDLLHGVNCLLGRTGAEMANHFFRIYSDKKLANELAKNGRKLYEERNLPAAATKLFIEKIERL
jgi:glycosyltransferase involved in cell wall biosynthesis